MKKRIKVLMFGWEFPPLVTGGLGTSCYGLTRHLALNDVDTIFVLPKILEPMHHFFLEVVDGSSCLEGMNIKSAYKSKSDHEIYSHLAECITHDSLLEPYSSKERYTEIYDQLNNKTEFGKDIFEEVNRYAEMAKSIAMDRKFDLIHVHDWMSFEAGIIAKQLSGKPLVVHIHTTEYDRNAGRENREILAIEKRGFDAADKIIAVSNQMKEQVSRQYNIDKSKIEVVYNAIEKGDTVDLDHQIEFLNNKKVVFFLGRITSQKGPGVFLDAAEILLKERNDIIFIMAGDGDMAPYIIEECQKRELDDYFFFPGHLRSAEKEKLFAISDLYILPSLAEPFGITPVEVMSYDIPIIMTEGLGAHEIIPEALEFKFNDSVDLANKIIRVLDSSTEQKSITVNYGKNLDRLDWNISAQKVKSLYCHILGMTVER